MKTSIVVVVYVSHPFPSLFENPNFNKFLMYVQVRTITKCISDIVFGA
jgi:hypothetical protein